MLGKSLLHESKVVQVVSLHLRNVQLGVYGVPLMEFPSVQAFSAHLPVG